jgi:tRNA(fMet)-specific endonuclease VapC
MWLPDTNAWIRFLNPQASPVKSHFSMRATADIFLCDVVKAELYYGAFKSTRCEANLALLETLNQNFPSLPFDSAAARHFGQIRAALGKAGTPIGPYDLQIAAIAVQQQLILVTHNTKEFMRIPELRLEDWEM